MEAVNTNFIVIDSAPLGSQPESTASEANALPFRKFTFTLCDQQLNLQFLFFFSEFRLRNSRRYKFRVHLSQLRFESIFVQFLGNWICTEVAVSGLLFCDFARI